MYILPCRFGTAIILDHHVLSYLNTRSRLKRPECSISVQQLPGQLSTQLYTPSAYPLKTTLTIKLYLFHLNKYY